MPLDEPQSPVRAISFTLPNGEPVTDRRPFYELFSQFGEITKLYICPTGTYGAVFFSSVDAVREAFKRASNVPPLYLKLSPYTSKKQKQFNNGSVSGSTSEMEDDIIEAGKTVMYDVYGNPVDVFEDDDGRQYVPYYQMSKAGYKLYAKQEIEKRLRNTDRLLNEFNLYMLTKARKFMRENDLILNEIQIENTISNCRKTIFNAVPDHRKQSNSNNLRITVKQNNSIPSNLLEVSPKKLRQPNNKPVGKQSSGAGNQSPSPGGGDQKRLPACAGAVPLKEECFQKVLITHVEGTATCYVTPVESLEFKNQLMGKINEAAPAGKTMEPLKHLVYGCRVGQHWYRATITKKDREVEAFLIDDGKKAVVENTKSLPKNLLDVPAQAVFIQLAANQTVILKEGNIIEVKPIEKLENGYVVEVKKQPGFQKKGMTTSQKFSQAESEKPQNGIEEVKRQPESTVKQETKREEVKNHPLVANKQQNAANKISTNEKIQGGRKCIIDNLSSAGIFCCTEVIDSETFVAYLLSDDSFSDLALLEEIQIDCVSSPDYRPKPGEVVAVEKKEEESKWVRGLVSEIKNGDYLCALIDYGVTQLCSEVRKLPEKYVNIPDFACVCKTDPESLKKIEAGRDSVQYIITAPGTLQLKLDDETFVATAKTWNPVCPVPQKTYKALPSPSLANGNVVKVKAIDESAFAFLCETKQCSERFKEITSYIADVSPEVLESRPELEQLVLSPCEGENGLFRGVVRALKGDLVEVYFIDYGNTDTVRISDLRNVDDKLAGWEPALIDSPTFEYLKGRKLSADVFDYFDQNMSKLYRVIDCDTKFDLKSSDGDLLSKILEDLDNKQAAVAKQGVSKQEEDKKSVSTSSCNLGSIKQEVSQKANPSQTSLNETKPEAPKTTKIKFTYSDLKHMNLTPGNYQCLCTSCDELGEAMATFIPADEKTITKLSDLQAKIDEHVKTETAPFDADELDLCVAIFEDMWYRGTVVEKKPEGCNIYFVDYGNTATVTTENIRRISEELAALPATAMICQLDGINNVSESLCAELTKRIMENEEYEVEIVSKSTEDERHIIRIPAVYEKIKQFLE